MIGRNKQKEEARKREQRRVLMQRYKKQRKQEVRVLKSLFFCLYHQIFITINLTYN